jgi:molybdate transport system substrate-binding protein
MMEAVMWKRVVLPAVLAAGLVVCSGITQAAPLKVMADSPLGPALSKIVNLYDQQMQTRVELILAPSPVVKEKIEAGEAADVVIVQPDFLDDLKKSGKVVAGDRPMIGRVGIGLGTRSDRPVQDISTAEKLKTTLLGADTLSFNKVKSGNHFATVLERLGIAEVLNAKIVRTSPNGIFEPVLKGHGNDIAAGTIPFIATTPGVKYLGPLPGDLQEYLTYTAAPLANRQQGEAAENFIKFLTSSVGKDAFASNGVD